MTGGPLAAYRERQRAGRLMHDPAQALAAEKLQLLWRALGAAAPDGRAGWRARLGLARRPAAEAPQGLYLHGPVGRGKSMLMDLFFAAVADPRKRRDHFHAFMLDVHGTMHRWRRRDGRLKDPLPRIAAEIAAGARLLCFDELQVDNIADAMILGRLFEALFDEGVVVVATGNARPDDLYRDGLQRDRFLPFVALLKSRVEVLALDGVRDYRRDRLAGMPAWHVPPGAAAAAALDEAFALLAGGAPPRPAELRVMGRTLAVPAAAEGVARFPFAALCGGPRGAPDYLALARAYRAVILEDVPVMGPGRREEARRLVTLVDALYEQGALLLASAEAGPDALCADPRTAALFARAASRLVEMGSAEYVRAARAGT